MRIEFLKKRDARKFSSYAGRRISRHPYYTPEAKKVEKTIYTYHVVCMKLRDPWHRTIVAKEADRFVGFCCGYRYGGVFAGEGVFAENNAQNPSKTIKRSLIDFAQRYAKRKRMHKISFMSRTDDTETNALLHDLQFHKSLVRRDYHRLDFYSWSKFI